MSCYGKTTKKNVVGAYKTHFFTMRAAKKWKIIAFFLPDWNMSNLDQNAFLHNNDKLIILQYQKFHIDMRFRFRDFLQNLTVPPNFSKRVYVPSESKAHLFFESSECYLSS